MSITFDPTYQCYVNKSVLITYHNHLYIDCNGILLLLELE